MSYPLQILLSVLLGCTAGTLWGDAMHPFGEVGMLLIQLLKILAVPLIFFAIINAFCQTQIRAKSGLQLLFLSSMNATVAALIAFALSRISLFEMSGSFLQEITGLINSHPTHQQTPVILSQVKILLALNLNSTYAMGIALVFGVGLRFYKNPGFEHGVQKGFQISSAVLAYVIRGIPFAVFGVIASLVGKGGWKVFSLLGPFLLWVTLGLFTQVVLYYSLLIFIFLRRNPTWFFKSGGESILTALGTGSSLATLPVTLRVLHRNFKVSHESASLAACVGTNLNHDGILLYEATAALFVAQVYGIHLSGKQVGILFGSSVLAAVGIAGVPDAGLMTLSLVLSSTGLPLGLVPLLMTVDWIIGRMRAATNVSSDLIVALLLDRFQKAKSLS